MTRGEAAAATMESPRYVLQQQLAAGGMGVVHLGSLVTPAGERRVAIKRVLPRGDLDESARARLVAEARLVFQLTHANVCQVLDLCTNAGGTFAVMEYIEGLDLRALLKRLAARGQRLDIASAIYVAREVARALDYAHRRIGPDGQPLRVIHGDVTPANILLSVEGEVKLADFGIARALGTIAPGTHVHAGTPGFIAPEAASGVTDHRADIFALGVTLKATLTGRRNPDAPTGGDIRHLRPEVTPELAAILARATAARPHDRFLSAAELEQSLALELARRHPQFTPSALAGTVSQNRTHEAAAPPLERGELVSLIASDARTAPAAFEPPRDQQGGTRTAVPPPPRRGSGLRVAVLLALVAGLTFAGWSMWSRPGRPAELSPMQATKAAPETAEAQPAAVAEAQLPQAADRQPLVAANANTRAAPARGKRKAPARTARAPEASPVVASAAARAFVTISASPWGAVYIDGLRIADETPVYRHALAPGTHELKVFFPEKGVFSRPRRVSLRPGEVKTLGFQP